MLRVYKVKVLRKAENVNFGRSIGHRRKGKTSEVHIFSLRVLEDGFSHSKLSLKCSTPLDTQKSTTKYLKSKINQMSTNLNV